MADQDPNKNLNEDSKREGGWCVEISPERLAEFERLQAFYAKGEEDEKLDYVLGQSAPRTFLGGGASSEFNAKRLLEKLQESGIEIGESFPFEPDPEVSRAVVAFIKKVNDAHVAAGKSTLQFD